MVPFVIWNHIKNTSGQEGDFFMVDQQELSSAGLKFMDFAIRFFNMAKCQYQQQNQVKANKAGFQVLLF